MDIFEREPDTWTSIFLFLFGGEEIFPKTTFRVPCIPLVPCNPSFQDCSDIPCKPCLFPDQCSPKELESSVCVNITM